jgi:hypothetical protein
MTIALVFLMTQLILPGDRDRIVTRMIHDIEFQRAIHSQAPAEIQLFDLPAPVTDEPPPIDTQLIVEGPIRELDDGALPVGKSVNSDPEPAVDWWAEASRIAQESGEEATRRWLLEQGHERYVSIMQGPMPIRNPVQGSLPLTQENATGYLNTYGDMEIKVSKNCVAKTQVAARLDISDFARKLPMRIVCVTPKVRYSFDRDDGR